MSKLKLLSVSILVFLCVMCGMAATASAIPVWFIDGMVLSGTHRTDFDTTTSMNFRWKDGTESFHIECTKAKSTELLEGNTPGTSKVESITFEPCTYTAPAECKVTTPVATALPWATRLESDRGTIYSVFNMDAETTLSGCTNTAYNKTWPIKGSERARMTNLVANLQVKFPEEVLEGDTLETEGDPVTFSGEGEMVSEEKGGSVQVKEVC